LVAQSDDVISLGVGEPDFVTPWNIRAEAIYSLEKGHTGYTSNIGLPELRREISHYQAKNFGNHYDPDEIIITVGASEGVDISLRAILNPGDEVIVPEPSYVCYSPLVQLAGGKVVSVDTAKHDFLPEDIEKFISAKTKAIILCSPNNPTGRVIGQNTLKKIAQLAKKHDFWVLSDEIYADLTYDGSFTSIAALPDMKERTILLSGFSKAFAMTGWRLGYLCGPDELLKRALKIHQYAIMCAPTMAQYAGIEAMQNAQGDVKDMRESYHQRRNLVVGRFNDMGLKTVMPEGAFYCFPSIKSTGLSSQDFALQLLKSKKVAVVPGTAFGKNGEGFVRCCYATSLRDLKTATQRIKEFIAEIR
jgi:aminotransferase